MNAGRTGCLGGASRRWRGRASGLAGADELGESRRGGDDGVRVQSARLAGEPPDVLIAPRLGHIGILDFDRSEELIELGRTSTDAMGPAITLAVRRA